MANGSERDALSFLIKKYLLTVDDDAERLRSVLNDLNILDPLNHGEYRDVIDYSAANLVNKWKSRSKVLRTEVALNVIPDYPESVLENSIVIDAIINLLDDLYDENLGKRDIGLYVVELVRLLSNLERQNLSDQEREKISHYFMKILSVAIVELKYIDKIKYSQDFSEEVKYSIECYNCKSTDFDIFIELPLLVMNLNQSVRDYLVRLGEAHRAIYIILKDLKDIEHDVQNNIETPVVILTRSKNGSLKSHVEALIGHYKERANDPPPEETGEAESMIIKNFRRLIESTLREIENQLNNGVN